MDSALWRQGRKLQEYPLFGIGRGGWLDPCQLMGLIIRCALSGHSPEQQVEGFSADSLYHHLRNKLTLQKVEVMLHLQMRRNLKLLHRRHPWRRMRIAIDFTDEMFYGERPTRGVVGTKHKAGSNWAFRFLTFSIVVDGCRFMLWAYPMQNRSETTLLVEKGLKAIQHLGLRPHLILMDREFNTTEILSMLEDQFTYLVPADHDSRFCKAAAVGLPACYEHWQIGNEKDGLALSTLVILQEGKEVYGYLTNIPKKEFASNVESLSDLYGKRWGIETGFRCCDDFRLSTCCKNLDVRYLYFCLALLLYNVWVWINLFFSLKTSDPRHLTIDNLKEWLNELVDEHHRLRSEQGWFGRCINGALCGGQKLACLSGRPQAFPMARYQIRASI